MSDTPNIYQRLNTIRSKVSYVRKDKTVENYKAVTHDAIVAETRQWFIELGVLIVPCELESRMVETGAKSQKGNALYRYEGTFEVKFVNCDEPEQFVSVRVTAHANDYGDKSPGKAITYATKSAVLKILYLETGENEEGRVPINAMPGDEVEEEALQSMLKAIESAATMEELQAHFKAAYTRSEKDRDALALLMKAKDARKATLQKEKK